MRQGGEELSRILALSDDIGSLFLCDTVGDGVMRGDERWSDGRGGAEEDRNMTGIWDRRSEKSYIASVRVAMRDDMQSVRPTGSSGEGLSELHGHFLTTNAMITIAKRQHSSYLHLLPHTLLLSAHPLNYLFGLSVPHLVFPFGNFSLPGVYSCQGVVWFWNLDPTPRTNCTLDPAQSPGAQSLAKPGIAVWLQMIPRHNSREHSCFH
ncbi:hypothetical protein DPEC_G00271900 [Dallia pectoralis]|uniref:Uncharacterized protein n=1 Tax=Dallia pectoralis TaxID=75939 RepID=A0ACC2FPV2_DALPE|nr:hypothetical protein DPEC_G00271900 [Dallia pectoralis]